MKPLGSICSRGIPAGAGIDLPLSRERIGAIPDVVAEDRGHHVHREPERPLANRDAQTPVNKAIHFPNPDAMQSRIEQAEARAEKAESRTEQAKTRADSAETRTEQAETRTEFAKTRAENAEIRTGLAETRAEQAETAMENRIQKKAGGAPLKTSPAAGTTNLPALERLTERQRQILQLIAKGENTKRIAGMLQISPKTVEYHRMKTMSVLNVHDIPGLVRFAVRAGLISPED